MDVYNSNKGEGNDPSSAPCSNNVQQNRYERRSRDSDFRAQDPGRNADRRVSDNENLVIQNMCNQRSERMQRKCEGGNCSCYASDTDEKCPKKTQCVTKHKLKSKDSRHETKQMVLCTSESCLDTNRNDAGPSREPGFKYERKKSDNVKIEVITKDGKRMHECSKRKSNITAVEETSDSDMPLVHITQEIRKDVVISQIRVNTRRMKSSKISPPRKSGGVHRVQKKSRESTSPRHTRKLRTNDRLRDSIDCYSTDSLSEKPKFDGRGGNLLKKRLAQNGVRKFASEYAARTDVPPKKPPRSANSSSDCSFGVNDDRKHKPAEDDRANVTDLKERTINANMDSSPGKPHLDCDLKNSTYADAFNQKSPSIYPAIEGIINTPQKYLEDQRKEVQNAWQPVIPSCPPMDEITMNEPEYNHPNNVNTQNIGFILSAEDRLIAETQKFYQPYGFYQDPARTAVQTQNFITAERTGKQTLPQSTENKLAPNEKVLDSEIILNISPRSGTFSPQPPKSPPGDGGDGGGRMSNYTNRALSGDKLKIGFVANEEITPEILRMLTYEPAPGANAFSSQQPIAEPQQITYEPTVKLNLDTVDGGKGKETENEDFEMFADNMAHKSTPVKSNLLPQAGDNIAVNEEKKNTKKIKKKVKKKAAKLEEKNQENLETEDKEIEPDHANINDSNRSGLSRRSLYNEQLLDTTLSDENVQILAEERVKFNQKKKRRAPDIPRPRAIPHEVESATINVTPIPTESQKADSNQVDEVKQVGDTLNEGASDQPKVSLVRRLSNLFDNGKSKKGKKKKSKQASDKVEETITDQKQQTNTDQNLEPYQTIAPSLLVVPTRDFLHNEQIASSRLNVAKQTPRDLDDIPESSVYLSTVDNQQDRTNAEARSQQNLNQDGLRAKLSPDGSNVNRQKKMSKKETNKVVEKVNDQILEQYQTTAPSLLVVPTRDFLYNEKIASSRLQVAKQIPRGLHHIPESSVYLSAVDNEQDRANAEGRSQKDKNQDGLGAQSSTDGSNANRRKKLSKKESKKVEESTANRKENPSNDQNLELYQTIAPSLLVVPTRDFLYNEQIASNRLQVAKQVPRDIRDIPEGSLYFSTMDDQQSYDRTNVAARSQFSPLTVDINQDSLRANLSPGGSDVNRPNPAHSSGYASHQSQFSPAGRNVENNSKPRSQILEKEAKTDTNVVPTADAFFPVPFLASQRNPDHMQPAPTSSSKYKSLHDKGTNRPLSPEPSELFYSLPTVEDSTLKLQPDYVHMPQPADGVTKKTENVVEPKARKIELPEGTSFIPTGYLDYKLPTEADKFNTNLSDRQGKAGPLSPRLQETTTYSKVPIESYVQQSNMNDPNLAIQIAPRSLDHPTHTLQSQFSPHVSPRSQSMLSPGSSKATDRTTSTPSAQTTIFVQTDKDKSKDHHARVSDQQHNEKLSPSSKSAFIPMPAKTPNVTPGQKSPDVNEPKGNKNLVKDNQHFSVPFDKSQPGNIGIETATSAPIRPLPDLSREFLYNEQLASSRLKEYSQLPFKPVGTSSVLSQENPEGSVYLSVIEDNWTNPEGEREHRSPPSPHSRLLPIVKDYSDRSYSTLHATADNINSQTPPYPSGTNQGSIPSTSNKPITSLPVHDKSKKKSGKGKGKKSVSIDARKQQNLLAYKKHSEMDENLIRKLYLELPEVPEHDNRHFPVLPHQEGAVYLPPLSPRSDVTQTNSQKSNELGDKRAQGNENQGKSLPYPQASSTHGQQSHMLHDTKHGHSKTVASTLDNELSRLRSQFVPSLSAVQGIYNQEHELKHAAGPYMVDTIEQHDSETKIYPGFSGYDNSNQQSPYFLPIQNEGYQPQTPYNYEHNDAAGTNLSSYQTPITISPVLWTSFKKPSSNEPTARSTPYYDPVDITSPESAFERHIPQDPVTTLMVPDSKHMTTTSYDKPMSPVPPPLPPQPPPKSRKNKNSSTTGQPTNQTVQFSEEPGAHNITQSFTKSKSDDNEKQQKMSRSQSFRKKTVDSTKKLWKNSKNKFLNLSRKKDEKSLTDGELKNMKDELDSPISQFSRLDGRRYSFSSDNLPSTSNKFQNRRSEIPLVAPFNINNDEFSPPPPPKPPRSSVPVFDFNRTVDPPKVDKSGVRSPFRFFKSLNPSQQSSPPISPHSVEQESYKSYGGGLNDDMSFVMKNILGSIRTKLETSDETTTPECCQNPSNCPHRNISARVDVHKEPLYAEIVEQPGPPDKPHNLELTKHHSIPMLNIVPHILVNNDPKAVYAKVYKDNRISLTKSQSLNNLSKKASGSEIFLENLFRLNNNRSTPIPPSSPTSSGHHDHSGYPTTEKWPPFDIDYNMDVQCSKMPPDGNGDGDGNPNDNNRYPINSRKLTTSGSSNSGNLEYETVDSQPRSSLMSSQNQFTSDNTSFNTARENYSSASKSTSSNEKHSGFKNKLRKSFRKGKSYLKTETKRFSDVIDKTISKAESAIMGEKRSASDYEINERYGMELLSEISTQDSIKQQLKHAVNFCREMPEFENSTELVEAERLLLMSNLKEDIVTKELIKIDYMQEGLVPSMDGRNGVVIINSFEMPVKVDPNYDTFYSYFYIGVFSSGVQMKSTYSEEKRENSVVFRDCNIIFENLGSDFEIKVDIYVLRLRRMSSIKLQRDKKSFLRTKKNSSSSVDSKEDVVSRFRIHGYFTLRAQNLTPYKIKENSNKFLSIDKFTLVSDTSCYLPISLISKNTNLLDEARLSANAEIVFNNFEVKGFLNVEDSGSNKNNWNRRWCQVEAFNLFIWNYPQDCNEKEPILIINLTKCLTYPVDAVDRSVCAKPRSFMLDVKGDENDNDSDNTRMYLFSTDNQNDFNCWISRLNNVLDFIRIWKA